MSLAAATNLLAALTGSASGGLTIALDALAETYLARASEAGLLHRVAVIGAGTLDILPHSGAVVTLLGICGSTHREGYRDLAIAGIGSAALAHRPGSPATPIAFPETEAPTARSGRRLSGIFPARA